MSYIIVTRNPRNKLSRLVIIDHPDGESPAEFTTPEAANEAALTQDLCKAWGFTVVEIEHP